MSTETQERPTDEKEPLGRRYWLLFGFGGGLFVTVAIAIAVMIATASGPEFAPEASLPTSGADEMTVIGTEFAFDPDELVLSPNATITFDNQGVVVHNIEIDGVAGFKVEAQAGQTATGSIDVAPGEYVIFCSIPGHREAGMEGSLTVATG